MDQLRFINNLGIKISYMGSRAMCVAEIIRIPCT